jgi:hypothetical protein
MVWDVRGKWARKKKVSANESKQNHSPEWQWLKKTVGMRENENWNE